jgi:hypothetical protein
MTQPRQRCAGIAALTSAGRSSALARRSVSHLQMNLAGQQQRHEKVLHGKSNHVQPPVPHDDQYAGSEQ